MTIILFLVDTSSSMCQKAYVNGVQKSYLDIAKGAVETFLKYRQRTQDCLGDRYMLLTFEEPPANIKAGWKENHATFMNELKNLQSTGLTSMGESLKNAFDLLNLNRMQSGIDTYGQGRCPFYLEPSVIIVITDGGRYSFRNGVHQEIILPLSTQIPGTKFTKEPFRWDQRLFSLVLRMSGNKIDERVEGKVPHDDSPIERMCEVTGGRSYRVRSHHVLNQCLESLVQKVQAGVVLQFEPLLKDGGINENQQDILFQATKKMIYVQKHVSQKAFPMGYWPLPEPYWPDPKAVTLPPRDAHPKLKIVMPAVDEPQMVRSFPVDKYEIEASPLTLQILQKREINKCWQVIVTNGMHGFELPFGYLKAAPNFAQVHLYVLAYNYPALLPLLHDLIHKYNMSPPNDLMYKFNAYVRSIPPYYCPFLRKALTNINVPYPLLQFLLPENADNYLSPTIANQLKHIKNTAKQDQENLCMKVYKQLKQPKPPYRQIETAKLNTGVPVRRELVRHPLLRDTFIKLHSEIEPIENYTIVVPQTTRQSSAKTYRNPFDIPRRDLIDDIARMREMLLRPTPTSLIAKDSGHCLPIADMGNYQEYLKNKDIPLREIEPTNVRQHMFGNPYKKDKHMVMVDEADLNEISPMKNNNGGGAPVLLPSLVPTIPGMKKIDTSRARKRKAGPIRKDFIFRRTSIDSQPSSRSSSISSAGSSVASLSDFDDDSMSETSSISSTISEAGDRDRLVAPFDFIEEEQTDQDFPLNGHVRNFINGISDENSCDNEIVNNSGATTANINVGNNTGANGSGSGTTISGLPATSGVYQTPTGLVNHTSGMPTTTIVTTPTPTTAAAAATIMMQPPLQLHQLTTINNNETIVAATLTTIQTSTTSTHPFLSNYRPQEPTTPPPSAIQAISYNPTTTSISAITPIGPTSSSIGISYSPQQMNGNVYTGLSAASVGQMIPIATAPVTLNTPPATTYHHHHHHSTPAHNDINDAQEISRILQQCHNGIGTTSSINTAHPGNGSTFEAAIIDIKIEPEAASISQNIGSTSTAAATSLSNSFDTLKRETNMPQNLLTASTFASSSAMSLPTAAIGGGVGGHHHINQIQNQNQNQNHHHHHNSIANHLHAGQQQQQQSNHQHGQINNHQPNQHNHTNHTNHQNSNMVMVQQQQQQQQPPVMTEDERDAARLFNLGIRKLIFQDIRRPGRNYNQLMDHLNLVKGDAEIKSNFVQMCISETMRFGRIQMVKCIQNWWDQKDEQQLNHNQQQQFQQHRLQQLTNSS